MECVNIYLGTEGWRVKSFEYTHIAVVIYFKQSKCLKKRLMCIKVPDIIKWPPRVRKDRKHWKGPLNSFTWISFTYYASYYNVCISVIPITGTEWQCWLLYPYLLGCSQIHTTYTTVHLWEASPYYFLKNIENTVIFLWSYYSCEY